MAGGFWVVGLGGAVVLAVVAVCWDVLSESPGSVGFGPSGDVVCGSATVVVCIAVAPGAVWSVVCPSDAVVGIPVKLVVTDCPGVVSEFSGVVGCGPPVAV